jgi:hypothetical protein
VKKVALSLPQEEQQYYTNELNDITHHLHRITVGRQTINNNEVGYGTKVTWLMDKLQHLLK